jgi:hypothetical protein
MVSCQCVNRQKFEVITSSSHFIEFRLLIPAGRIGRIVVEIAEA